MSRKPRPWGENQQITASTGQRWRQAIERAATVPRPGRGSKFSAAELRAVMSGLSYWLLSRDRTDGEVTLAQIAQASGLWHGEHEDCPREITKALGAAASYLARYRAINYRPGGSRGRGSPSWFGAPELAEGSFLDRKSSTGPRTLEARNDPERWERALEVRWVPGAPPTDPLGGFPAPRKGGSLHPERGVPETPHSGRTREELARPSRQQVAHAGARRPDRRSKAPTVDELTRLERWDPLVHVVRFALDEEDPTNARAFVVDLFRSNLDDSELAALFDKWGTELDQGPAPTAETMRADARDQQERTA